MGDKHMKCELCGQETRSSTKVCMICDIAYKVLERAVQGVILHLTLKGHKKEKTRVRQALKKIIKEL